MKTATRSSTFSFPLADFKTAFSLVSRAVPSSAHMPILKSVKLDIEGCTVEMQATDLEVGIRHKMLLPNLAEPPTSVVLPAKMVGDILRNADGDELEFDLADDRRLTISCASAEWRMPTEDPSLYPAAPGFRATTWHEMSADELATAIRRTASAAGDDDQRGAFSNLAFEPQLLQFTIVGASNGALASQKVGAGPVGSIPARDQPYLIPARLVEKLRAILPGDDRIVRVGFPDENWANFAWGDTSFCCKLAAGSFPAWRQFLPRDPIASFSTACGPFRAAIACATVHLSADTRRMEIGPCDHEDNFDDSMLHLGCESRDGKSRSELPLEYAGDIERVENFGVNPRYLSGMLAGLGDDVTPTFHIHDRNWISVATDDGFIGVIVPLEDKD